MDKEKQAKGLLPTKLGSFTIGLVGEAGGRGAAILGAAKILCSILAAPRIALFWTVISDVPGICCSHSLSLGVTALSAPIISCSSFSHWHFLSFSCSFLLMLVSLGIATSIITAFFCCLLTTTVVSHHNFISLDLEIAQGCLVVGAGCYQMSDWQFPLGTAGRYDG